MAPVFSWLGDRRPEGMRGTLAGIFVADEAGQPMRRLQRCEALTEMGLAGDRYASDSGRWKRTDTCQVTLVAEKDLLRAERRSGLPFAGGQHRRNLVVRGIPLAAFRERQVRIGTVLFAFHRLRPPCGYLERLVGPGTVKALAGGAGIGLTVVEGGTLRVGDEVRLLPRPIGRARRVSK
jgi:MOSC domain-containing protein YiiM